MNLSCTRISEINTEDGRVMHEISTCCTAEYGRHHRISGWDDGYFIGGSAVSFNFPNHQVITPQEDDTSDDEWIGASIGGDGGMVDSVSDETEVAWDLLNDLAPWADVVAFYEFWTIIATAQEDDNNYDYK